MNTLDTEKIKNLLYHYKETHKEGVLDIAKATGVSKQSVYNLFKGTNPTLKTLNKYQNFLIKNGLLRDYEGIPPIESKDVSIPSKEDVYRLIQYVGENDTDEKKRTKWIHRIMVLRDEIIKLEEIIDSFTQRYNKVLEELKNDYNKPLPGE